MGGLALGCLLVTGMGEMAQAHHGLDFLLVQDAFVPGAGKGVVYGGFDWTREGGAEGYKSESGVMLGLLPGLALGVGMETADVGEGWRVDGIAPVSYTYPTLPPKKEG